jgi:hypothetical protein
VTAGAAGLSLLAFDLDDAMRGQTRPPLRDELLDAFDRLHSRSDFVVWNGDQFRLALHAAPLVQLGRAFRRAPTEN